MTTPLVLGFDTSAAYCAAALVRGDTVLGAVGEDMARGQAERLMGLLQDLLAAHQVTWSDLDALAVGTGPGNFTDGNLLIVCRIANIEGHITTDTKTVQCGNSTCEVRVVRRSSSDGIGT